MSNRIKGKVVFESNLKAVLKATQEIIDRGLEQCGMEAVDLTARDAPSKSNPYLTGRGTPVDTGRLKNSITWAVQDKHGGGSKGQGESVPYGPAPQNVLVIGTNVEYAEVIEEGSYNRRAYHMLRNALTDGADRFERIMTVNFEAANANNLDGFWK